MRLSLRVAFWATLVSLPVAVLAAHALARRSFPGKAVLNGLVHLPLILPPVVTGYLLLLTFGTRGTPGAWLAETGASSSPSAGRARRWPPPSWRSR